MRENSRLGEWYFCILALLLIFSKIDCLLVDITFLDSAVSKGAVCLDGSPPAYHLARGFGTGINNWLVQIEGGGWCNNPTTCLARKNNHLGSSKLMVKKLAFSGILSDIKGFNPDFYNWNKVKVRYCDGSSFTGDVEAVNPVTNLHFRGARIFRAVLEDLLAKGLKTAQNAILSGCSAGGLTSIFHCDTFRSMLPKNARVKCFADAGYFINAKDISGAQHTKEYFNGVVTLHLHGSLKNLPGSCKLNPGLCFFPQYFAQKIQTPLFLINAAYDSWQIRNTLVPSSADPNGIWSKCKSDIKNCSPTQIKIMQGYRQEFLNALSGVESSKSNGWFINSCFSHCQTESQHSWLMNDSPRLNNTTIAVAAADWFYERRVFRSIDCPYPCDTTCRNNIYPPTQPFSSIDEYMLI